MSRIFISITSNRESFNGTVTERPQVQHSSIPGIPSTYGIGGVLESASVILGGDVEGPLPHENGWKDTFIVPPGQVGRLIARFDRPGRYVWHCHILSHEDHEMMRPFHVGTLPAPPPLQGVADQNNDLEQMNGFRLYPNPVMDRATIEFVLDGDAEVSIRLFNLDGRVAKSENLGSLKEGYHNHTFTSDQLESGMYILEMKAGSRLYRESIIISK